MRGGKLSDEEGEEGGRRVADVEQGYSHVMDEALLHRAKALASLAGSKVCTEALLKLEQLLEVAGWGDVRVHKQTSTG